MAQQDHRPDRNKGCKNCHKKEWSQIVTDNQLKWVQVHPKQEHGRACQSPPCGSLSHCKTPSCM